jgi:hypothetical protein
MTIVRNTVDNKIIGKFNETEFIDFVSRIVKENDDDNYSVLGMSDAEEYIEDYCDNLEIVDEIKYAVILNFESGKVEVLSLDNKPANLDSDEFIELPTEDGGLGYNLSNCNYMVTDDITMYNLNF